MKLQWLRHACFQAKAKGYSIAIDPYEDGSVPWFHKLSVKADEA